MANMIDLDSFRKLSYYSDFETRSLNVLELMVGIFGPHPINPVNIEGSLLNENWPLLILFPMLILLLIPPRPVYFVWCSCKAYGRIESVLWSS